MSSMTEPPQRGSHLPDFLTRTTVGCSLIVMLLIVPFTVANFVQDRFVMGIITSGVALACGINVLLGLRGQYNLAINTFFVIPAGAIANVYILVFFGSAGSYWPFLLINAYYLLLPQKHAAIVNALTVLVLIPVAWSELEPPSALRFSAVIVGTSLFAYFTMNQIYKLHSLMRDQATKDPLTGLYNRMLLDDQLQQAIAQNQRAGTPMSLVLLDIDHFKQINDTHGHDVGDKVLVRLGQILRNYTRASDACFRMGGEEFLVLVHNADRLSAIQLAEKLRLAMAEVSMLPEKGKITLSAGVSSVELGMTSGEWLKDCDKRLYEAKNGGRNRVVG